MPTHEPHHAEIVPTIRMASVTAADSPPEPDATEDYHEASRIYARITDPHVVGAARLERSLEMRITASRSVKRYPQQPFVSLPRADLGSATLAHAVAARRSRRSFAARPLDLGLLATLLGTGYGVTGTVEGTSQALRTVPSGGALYPLELYVVSHRVEGLELALYHYDPLRHGLELLAPLDAPIGGELSPYGTPLADSAAVVAMTAMFWRSRFKYGARAYRFALMEAGHVAQNLLLAAVALDLDAVPLGGFYDRNVDACLGVDGIFEATLYLVPVGYGVP
ncbi:MAG TPA: SagB/ThcOx family dehydrogenase [Gaiella sp.]